MINFWKKSKIKVFIKIENLGPSRKKKKEERERSTQRERAGIPPQDKNMSLKIYGIGVDIIKNSRMERVLNASYS